MKITAGNPLERGKDLSMTNAQEYLRKLMEEGFNGYTCVTIKGMKGFQEGVLLFHDGKIVASSYDYFYYMRTYQAEPALERTLNAFNARIGIIDTFSLSSYQVQLVLTLNEEASLKKPVTASSLKMPEKYSEKYEQRLAEQSVMQEKKKAEIVQKLGLKGFLTGMTREDILKLAKEEDENLERMVK